MSLESQNDELEQRDHPTLVKYMQENHPEIPPLSSHS